jgi:hypothetical protein
MAATRGNSLNESAEKAEGRIRGRASGQTNYKQTNYKKDN